MKIRYLDGNRLYYAFLAGGQAVIRDQAYLNRINVFPVPDADTGTNLASTMRAIAEKARAPPVGHDRPGLYRRRGPGRGPGQFRPDLRPVPLRLEPGGPRRAPPVRSTGSPSARGGPSSTPGGPS